MYCFSWDVDPLMIGVFPQDNPFTSDDDKIYIIGQDLTDYVVIKVVKKEGGCGLTANPRDNVIPGGDGQRLENVVKSHEYSPGGKKHKKDVIFWIRFGSQTH